MTVPYCEELRIDNPHCENECSCKYYISKDNADNIIRNASAEPKWITDRKPTESGRYMVTLDSFGHKRIDLFYYGKPIMPNRKVRGKCWYRSDDEWGDVVYDDTDILAWMPLPKPYGEEKKAR